MSWRFRTSFNPIQGVRLTLSPRGITTSVGVGPLRVSSGPNGAAVTAHIPGTGVSLRHSLDARSAEKSPAPGWNVRSPSMNPPGRDGDLTGAMQAIRSGESSEMTSPGLAAFKSALEQAHSQFSQTKRELAGATQAERAAVERHWRWANGWVMKRLLKQRFAKIAEAAKIASALRMELQEQLDLSRLPTQFEMPDEIALAFQGLCEAFDALSRSQRVWDNVAHRATNRVAERTTAARVVDLKPVAFSLDTCGVIDTPMAVPKMANANGGDLFLFPGFLLYHATSTNYALVEYADLDIRVRRSHFHEESTPPSDARQVSTTWAKANKDGTPDRRFKDNRSIPVMLYATITLQSTSGLNEEYLVSNVEAAERFHAAWERMSRSRRPS